MQITNSNFSFIPRPQKNSLIRVKTCLFSKRLSWIVINEGGARRMRLVVTIQEILVTVSEKKKNLIIQVMLSELVIQGTKKYVVPCTRSNGENSEKSFTQCVSYLARNHSEICFC